MISKSISKNRSLSSKKRKPYLNWMMQTLRWGHVPSVAQAQTFEDHAQAIQDHMLFLSDNMQAVSENSLKTLGIPSWMMCGIGDQATSEEKFKHVMAFFQQASIYLRMNLYLVKQEVLLESLIEDGVSFERVDDAPYALMLLKKIQIQATKAYKKGWIDIQDVGSQWVVDQLDIQDAYVVVDGCSRTGGKSFAMQNTLRSGAVIHAVDVDARVFEEMKKRASRQEARNIKMHWIGTGEDRPLEELENKADCVLVDAPCSSMGTLKRRPWLKFAYNQSDIENFSKMQKSILTQQARWVKPGGQVAFAVCSILKAETFDVTRTFLDEHPDFQSRSEHLLYPDQTQGDAFYIHVMNKQK